MSTTKIKFYVRCILLSCIRFYFLFSLSYLCWPKRSFKTFSFFKTQLSYETVKTIGKRYKKIGWFTLQCIRKFAWSFHDNLLFEDMESMFHWEFLITIFSPCLLKFGDFYITGKWGRMLSEECYIMLTYTFFGIFFFFLVCVFHQKICVFIIFISAFDEASNFRNRILTNQKPELVIRNCQWNCKYGICQYT